MTPHWFVLIQNDTTHSNTHIIAILTWYMHCVEKVCSIHTINTTWLIKMHWECAHLGSNNPLSWICQSLPVPMVCSYRVTLHPTHVYNTCKLCIYALKLSYAFGSITHYHLSHPLPKIDPLLHVDAWEVHHLLEHV